METRLRQEVAPELAPDHQVSGICIAVDPELTKEHDEHVTPRVRGEAHTVRVRAQADQSRTPTKGAAYGAMPALLCATPGTV